MTTVLIVLAAWFGLGCLTAVLFAAVVRGSALPENADLSAQAEVPVPAPRLAADASVRVPQRL